MVYNLENASTINDIDNAIEAEVDINNKRNLLRDKEIQRVERNGNA